MYIFTAVRISFRNQLEGCCSKLTWAIKTGVDAKLLASILALAHPFI